MQNRVSSVNNNGTHIRLVLITLAVLVAPFCFGQGSWAPVSSAAPDVSFGGMVLLSDGSVICKTQSGHGDTIGNVYDKLTPDIHGSYLNGTWSTIAPMNNDRLYYATQVLKDGRVFVAGGEYGTGGVGSRNL